MAGLAGAVAATLLALASPASAANTADGFCTATGTITFGSPIGNTPIFTTFTDRAEARCTGTVNGVPGTDERVILRAKGAGMMGCTATQAVDRGVMRFTRNTRTKTDDVKISYIAESAGRPDPARQPRAREGLRRGDRPRELPAVRQPRAAGGVRRGHTSLGALRHGGPEYGHPASRVTSTPWSLGPAGGIRLRPGDDPLRVLDHLPVVGHEDGHPVLAGQLAHLSPLSASAPVGERTHP